MTNLKLIYTVLILICLNCINANAQLSAEYLEDLFSQNDSIELEKKFKELSKNTELCAIANENEINSIISELYSIILKCPRIHNDINYIILQKENPRIKLGEKHFEYTYPFSPKIDCGYLIPIKFENSLIYALSVFIGPNPTKSRSVEKYLSSNGFLKKYGYWNAKRKLKNYELRRNFIGQFLYTPGHYGQLEMNFVPVNFSSIEINKEMNEVKIKYDFGGSGGIFVYRLVNGEWKKTKDILTWVE